MSQHVEGESGALESAFEQPVERPPEPPVSRSAYILLVDDDQGIRQIVHDLLDDEGYTIITARNGAEALTQAPESPPALILLDSTLPSEHPGDVATMLRGRAGWDKTPVVLFTATERKNAVAVARELGAAEIIAKPFDLEEMLAVVERYLPPTQPRVSG